MPLADNRTSRDRVNFDGSLSRREIDELLRDSELRVLQTAEAIDGRTARRLNDAFFSERPDVQFRVYGSYSGPCDLGFLSSLTNVRDLAADCLHNASGIEAIVALPSIRRLRIGIWNLEDLGFLNDVSDDVESIFIGATKSKKPDLAPLSRFARLRTVYLEGQRKNIDVLAQLAELEEVVLRSITVPNLDFLRPLKKLWSLDLKLGGTTNFAAIESMARLRYLELWQVRGLADIGVVSTLTGLQHLFLQSLKNVRSLPDFRKLTGLRRITLESMKGLDDVSTLRDAPALTEYLHVAANNMQPEDYVPLLENASVRKVRIGFGSNRKNELFKAMLLEYGKDWTQFERFQFRDRAA